MIGFLRQFFGRPQRAASPGPARRLSKEELDAELKAWSIVTLENPAAGDPVILRLRERRPVLDGIAAFGTAVSIRWAYEGSSPFPPEDVQQRMADFETAIDPITWMNGFAELVLVSTGRGQKEWLLYTSDKFRFVTALHGLLAGHAPFPVAISVDEDPDWRIWGEVVESVQRRGRDGGQSA